VKLNIPNCLLEYDSIYLYQNLKLHQSLKNKISNQKQAVLFLFQALEFHRMVFFTQQLRCDTTVQI